ncbi:hypothetical protein [Salinisphaera sp. Q1T1-3]|uniref:hypothetical protein n=1 Tax=Salinisphaera sp. Q1T1-3 TaxID=2321229 RepID=UPI000E7376F4|nr:hypothetical protein [Salinisphaera sp. Q1T1-3]RJS92669.1 hypothetical protein D3260_10580 [Salinisphaera sp. Q1T1-3]
MKKTLTAVAVSLFALAPAASFAQSTDSSAQGDAATYPASGGAAGADSTKVIGYTALAGVGAAAAIGAAFAVADSGSDDKNVDLGGGTGTTGTTGTN